MVLRKASVDDGEAAGERTSTVRAILRHYAPWRLRVIAVLVCSVLYGSLEALGIASLLPLLERLGEDGVGGTRANALITRLLTQSLGLVGLELTIPTILGAISLLFVLSAVAQFVANYLAASTSWLHRLRVTTQLFEAYGKAEWDYVLRQPIGTVLAHLNAETSNAAAFLKGGLQQVSHITFILVLLLAALVVSFELTGLAVLFFGVALAVILVSSNAVRKAGIAILEETRRLSRETNQYLHGYKTVRAYGAFDSAGERVHRAAELREQAQKKIAALDAFLGVFPELLLLLVILGVVLLARTTAGAGLSELGVVVALLFRIAQRAKNMRGFAQVGQALPGVLSLEEVAQELRRSRASRTSPEEPIRLEQQVRFNDVSYTYPSRPEQPALRHVNLVIRRGEMLGIVGSSGAGKSTLTGLLLGLLRPTQGHVLVDERPLSDIGELSWLDNIGYVPQEPFLLDATIADNIRFFRDASDEQVRNAAHQAQVDGFVQGLPNGYETLAGNNGVELSGGQRQRICLARALLTAPPLLILDEATSSLDTESETAIKEAIASLQHSITMVVIAHRLSTLDGADRIVVLEQGQVIEEGARAELAGASGTAYRRLLDLQTGRT